MAHPPQAASYPALFRSLVKDAAAQGQALMQRVVVRAAFAMPQRAALSADVVERNLLAEAAVWLTKHEQALCDAYPQALLAEFAHAIAAGDGRVSTGVHFEGLRAMADDQLQENVDLARVQQMVAAAVEAPLAELDALVLALHGQDGPSVRRNPLHPQAYVRALHTVARQSPVPPSARRRWLLHLGEAMGPELAAVYADFSSALRMRGVRAVTPVAAAKRDGADARARAHTLLKLHELRALLAGDAAHPGVDPQVPAASDGSDFSTTVPAALEALQEMRQVDLMIQRLRQRQAAGGIDPREDMPALREALRGQARTPDQALGLEVVHLMVDNLAQDSRLLEPVRQAVRDLEPALLRLALIDPRFFSDRGHPARELLEEMTQRSLAWSSENAPGFAEFLDPLQQAVDALQDMATAAAEPFAFALQVLREAWGENRLRDAQTRERAARVLLQAEQRNLLAAQFAQEMCSRPEFALVPRPVAQFLSGPWSQVLAQARMADGGDPDPGGYAALVSDLLWSVQPRYAAADPVRLARLAPQLAQTLERGLCAIDYPPERIRRVQELLAALHRPLLRPGVGEASTEPRRRDVLDAQFAAEDDSAWPSSEAQPSGFPADVSASQPLQPGAWIEIFDGGWARWQLAWISPHGTLCMFMHASGRTQSMPRRVLDRMLVTGAARRVADQAVVDGALDAVAEEALRNSAAGPGI